MRSRRTWRPLRRRRSSSPFRRRQPIPSTRSSRSSSKRYATAGWRRASNSSRLTRGLAVQDKHAAQQAQSDIRDHTDTLDKLISGKDKLKDELEQEQAALTKVMDGLRGALPPVAFTRTGASAADLR